MSSQALSRPPVDICLLILHDSELVIFSAVKHPGKSILHFTVIKGLMNYELSSKRIMMSIAHTQMYFLLFALHSAVWVCELTAHHVASVTAPWWWWEWVGGGFRCRVCSNYCLAEIGHRVRLAGWSPAHPKHFSLNSVSRNTTHWQPAGIYKPDGPCICGGKGHIRHQNRPPGWNQNANKHSPDE